MKTIFALLLLISTAANATLTSSQFLDGDFGVLNTTDNTKMFKIDASTIATGSTVTLKLNGSGTKTFSSGNETMVGTDSGQTLTNKVLDSDTTILASSAAGGAGASTNIIFDGSAGSTGSGAYFTAYNTGARFYNFPDATINVTGDTNTQTLTNKSLSDTTTKIVNATSATKVLKFNLAGTTAGFTTTLIASATADRSVTLPNNNGTLARTSGDTFTSTFLQDGTSVQFFNGTDSSKRLVMDLSGESTAVTTTLKPSSTTGRTITLPDSTDTLATLTQVNAKEPALGNPALDGYILSSTAAGVRSWIVSPGAAAATANLVAVWNKDSTKTNIGASFVDVYTAGLNGLRQKVDFTSYTQYQAICHWQNVGGSINTVQIIDAVTTTNVLATLADTGTAAEKEVEAGFTTLPVWASGAKYLKVQMKSSNTTDDPVFHDCAIMLK